MKRIFTIGETVYDIIFSDGQPTAARAGGAMLNTAVNLGRLGLKPHLISEIGTDEIGFLISRFLENNGVNTDCCYRFSNGQTPISMAMLDEAQNASYSFYRNFPSQRLKITPPDFISTDLVMFGSYFSISNELRQSVKQIVTSARDAGAILFYDPNFRKAHVHELPMLIGAVRENIKMAHIIRASNEDFETLFGCQSALEAHDYCPHAFLFYTMGSHGCQVIAPNGLTRFWPARKINTVSTIGAGDTFNAGLAYGISRENLTFDDFSHIQLQKWDRVVKTALQMASAVCSSMDNYITQSIANQIADGTENG